MHGWIQYIETNEARTMREAYNLQSGSVLPPDTRLNDIFLPTSAGTVRIDIGKLTKSHPQLSDEVSYHVNKGRTRQSITSMPGKALSMLRKGSPDQNLSNDDSMQRLELGSPHMPPGPKGMLLTNEDLVPVSTAEVCCAPCAVDAGHAHGHALYHALYHTHCLTQLRKRISPPLQLTCVLM